jgi:ribosomal protein S18 acetylase RimI-like enzyme
MFPSADVPRNTNLGIKKWKARLLAHQEVAEYATSIRQLTRDEQVRQGGTLLRGVDLDAYLDRILARAEFAVLSREGKCVGFCAFYTYDSALDSAFITLFLMAPSVRRTGLARGMLEAVVSSSLQRGFRYLTLRVRDDNMPAIRFYLGQGFCIKGRVGSDLEMTLEMTAMATA